WIKTFKNDPGKLQYQKANDALVRSLHLIIQHCNDNAKVKKAEMIQQQHAKTYYRQVLCVSLSREDRAAYYALHMLGIIFHFMATGTAFYH
ncbi:12939_t:CDS:2, partial [Racocetra fulgida]